MATESWDLDLAHSSIGFWVRHLVISKVHGRFNKWSGKLLFDEAAPANSSVEVQIEVDSIDTHEERRDGHLKSPDFFDAATYPHMTFKSTKVDVASGDHFQATGDLTIRGITHPVVLDVEYGGRARDPWGGERAGFTAKLSIDRKDFGLSWNAVLEAGGVLVGEKVEIVIELEAVKAKAEAAV